MILAVDVQYLENTAFVAGVTFDHWSAQSPHNEYISIAYEIKGYEPGSFYKRELPCILKLIEEHNLKPDIIVVDGYVYLDGKQEPGLGKYLYDSLNGQIEVIGVAKRSFSGIGPKYELLRGKSKNPLYITTTGHLSTAIKNVSEMFGENRIPVLLKHADSLCRSEAKKSQHIKAK